MRRTGTHEGGHPKMAALAGTPPSLVTDRLASAALYSA